MVRTLGFAAYGRPLLAIAALSLFGTSVAFGWGRDITPPKGDYLFQNETEARDLMGRWRLDSVDYGAEADRTEHKSVASFDIVPCGGRYCGIAVGPDGICGAVLLTFDDRGSKFATIGADEWFERFAGSLDWHDTSAKYTVYLDADQEDHWGSRPLKNESTQLTLVGSSDGNLGRVIPLQINASYSGVAVCKAPTS